MPVGTTSSSANGSRDSSLSSQTPSQQPAVSSMSASSPGFVGLSGGSGGGGESTIDAAHIHFRERLGPLQTYHCHTCDDRFQAHSLLGVMEHFVRHSSTCSLYHSDCLYCGGKVHSYSLETQRTRGEKEQEPTTVAKDAAPPLVWTPEAGETGGGRRYYHDCGRWRRRQDR